MPVQPRWTAGAAAAFDDLAAKAKAALANRKKSGATKSTRAEGLFKQVEKCLRLLLANPKHPGLQTHAYRSLTNPFDPKGKVFEAYAQNNTPGAYRVFWCYGPGKDEITIIAITPHP